ncbi:MAG: asparagine synthase (glutamine-hydrolyzing) [Puniceicoccaceae bacterium]
MCGIFGFTRLQASPDEAQQLLERSISTLRHRGPDDEGVECFPELHTGLAHRRLSILDVSARGHQPMRSASGRYWICYNGEVYNFAALRAELEGAYAFRTECDTEVMLAAFERWGVQGSIPRFRGMFAFAVLDLQEQELYLVRDRMGIKPLYIGRTGDAVWFASELKALMVTGRFPRSLHSEALESYLAFNFVHGRASLIQGIERLEPGHFLKVCIREPSRDETVCYWNAFKPANLSPAEGLQGVELKAWMRDKLLESVKLRMVADVPLGAFLSGGVDSSLIAAMMQELSDRPVQTFTIRTEDSGYDESEHAAAVAQQLGTQHHCFTITHRKVIEGIEQAGSCFDEPMADVSMIPSLLVSQEARRLVTVALTGDGGDEVFGGYNRYFQTPRILRSMRMLPGSVRRSIGKCLGSSTISDVFHQTGILQRMVAGAEKLQKVSRLLQAESVQGIYARLIVRNPSFASQTLLKRTEAVLAQAMVAEDSSLARKLMRYDIETYLRGDILPKLDIASMQPSLEARVPFLDHELYEASLMLPDTMLMNSGKGKLLLREWLAERIDPRTFERPKMGFGIPMAQWLRHELKDWAWDVLMDSRNPAIFSRDELQEIWSRHLKSHQREDSEIWPLLLLFSWHHSLPVS